MRWSFLVLAACGRVGFDAGPDAALPPVIGELDPSFGDGGIFTASSDNEGQVWDIALRGAGYVTNGVSFNTAGTSRMEVIALAEDGTIDPAYGTDGHLFLQTPAGAFGYAIEMLADGSAIIAGDGAFGGEQDNFVLGKLTPAGAQDPSWGSGNFVNYNIPATNGGDTAWRVVTVDGTTYACGIADYNGDPRFTVLATRSDGTLDPRFAATGISTSNFSASDDECRDIAYDGARLVATGRDGNSVTIVHLGLDGTVGDRLTMMTGTGTGLALARDGAQIVVAEVGSGPAGYVMRFSGGALDPAFGVAGVVSTPRDMFSDVALDAAGRIVAIGRRDRMRPLIRRFLADGSDDPSFADAGVFELPIAGDLYTVAIDPRGRIVAGGYDDSGPRATPLVLRLR